MATTFDQRAKLHARVVELQELVLSQEGTLSCVISAVTYLPTQLVLTSFCIIIHPTWP